MSSLSICVLDPLCRVIVGVAAINDSCVIAVIGHKARTCLRPFGTRATGQGGHASRMPANLCRALIFACLGGITAALSSIRDVKIMAAIVFRPAFLISKAAILGCLVACTITAHGVISCCFMRFIGLITALLI